MKTLTTKEKRAAPAARKTHLYVHHSMGPVQQAQQVAIRQILRPGEVQAKQDIGENEGKYEQEPGRLLADLPVSVISGIPPGGPGGEPPLQRAESEEPEVELQRQAKEEEEEPIQAKLIQRQPYNEEEEEPVQARLIQRQVADMRGIRPSRFGYRKPEVKAQQAEIRRILRSTGVQAKLTIGQPNDKYEQEADRVADQVMAMPDPRLQRRPEEEETLQTKPVADQITPLVQRQEDPPEEEEETVQAKAMPGATPEIQRMCPECEEGQSLQRQPEEEEEALQAKEHPGHSPQVPPNVAANIQSLKGGGQPLTDSTLSFFEPRFDQDFSQVRIHTNANASDTAKALNARAFTLGEDVVFSAGEYSSGSSSGGRLLAHELAHVVQQGKSPASRIHLMPVALYADTDPLHDPSRLTDQEIEATDEYAAYMAMQAPPVPDQSVVAVFPDEARLACRLLLRDMREQMISTSPTNDDLLIWLDRARARRASTATAEGAVGTQQWVAASSTDVQNPATANSDFTRWMLAAGNQPDPTTGRLNCWEMVLFSAFRAGHLSESTIRGIYTRSRAAMSGPGGEMAFPRTLERELRSSNEYIYNPADPDTLRPLRGDLVIFREAAAHVALATGRRMAGAIEIVSHWPPPDGDHHVKLTTIEALLPRVGVTVAKFWSPIW